MSHNFDITAIEGDHSRSIRAWLEDAGYRIEVANDISDSDVASFFPFTHGHTLVAQCDSVDESFFVELSARLNCQIVRVVCGGTGDGYGFTSIENGRSVRSFWVMAGEILENTGNPLTEESGISFDETTAESEMLLMASKFGFDSVNNERISYKVVIPGPDDESRESNRFAGAIISTLICLIVAVVFFNIAPGFKNASPLFDFSMWYGFAAFFYVAIFHSFLQLFTPATWNRLFNRAFMFQLPFAIIFFCTLIFGKVTGLI